MTATLIDRPAATAFPEPTPDPLRAGPGMLLWDPLLHTLAVGLDDVEAVRISQSHRYGSLTRTEPDSDGEMRGFGLDERHPSVAALRVQLDTLVALEHQMAKALAKQLHTHPLHPWIKGQCGLGDRQVARLLAEVRDPYWNDLHDRPRTVSELWAFCGLHVLPAAGRSDCGSDAYQARTDAQRGDVGIAPARRRGQRANWSAGARSRAYVIAQSCIKKRQSPYRVVYDDGRAKCAELTHAVACLRCGPAGKPAQVGSPLSAGHQHARAMRLVMKAVLRDLWIESRRIYLAAEAATT